MSLPAVLPLLGLEGITLRAGGHDDRAAGVCAMEAVSWLAGEPHSDTPQCACPVIAAFMRNWNDSISDDAQRTVLLRPLLSLLIGTRSTTSVELRRSYLALDWLTRECAPAWLSLRDDLKAHAVALRGLTPLTDAAACRAAQSTLDAARTASAAAEAAARGAAWAAAEAAAWAAAGGAAGAAARDTAWDTAWAAARAAAWAAAEDALAPTVTRLQQSAADLVRRMAAMTEE